MKPIKLGIIGCGIAANHLHWPALQKLRDRFQITAVCNNTRSKGKAFAKSVGGVPYLSDYRELLKRPDVEAVDIALPIYLNYRVTKDALEAGKHVLVEKPLAVNLREAKQMMELENQHSQVKMVGENFYYHDAFRQIKNRLAQGRIGQPYAVFWDVFRKVDENNKYAQTSWRIHHKHPGGFITDGGVHNIAALRVMFEDIVAGRAFTKSVNQQIGKVDTLSFQFRTSGKVYGVLNIFASANSYFKNQFLILGTEGSLQVVNNQELFIMKSDDWEVEKIGPDTSYQKEFEDFYQAIRTGKKVVSSFREGYRDLEIMLHALNSANRRTHLHGLSETV
ncbi:Gfo/Idh/MocA family oxidoreductase [candidate division KSB1 bacterium]|nr:Gfo/Idh/MocA family oxidoreductase [candidate division KSB1 bacterium]NIR70131.1 Gfo/Idh/MocA family oxidoreductase [candidate division KSB1 bacterium]NIS27546.1 Gfo/Idh/MocA family oxidoreductase [candidate division KSB1 bacterium]NIT74396.1 Gfo/Idh/MocA family oxidoreductase [candidate division KSB1 bacterium]NIU28264.1 Gfo/Idh/MocA family oxidoreductase [candidate division KSB1 bacterium]